LINHQVVYVKGKGEELKGVKWNHEKLIEHDISRLGASWWRNQNTRGSYIKYPEAPRARAIVL